MGVALPGNTGTTQTLLTRCTSMIIPLDEKSGDVPVISRTISSTLIEVAYQGKQWVFQNL